MKVVLLRAAEADLRDLKHYVLGNFGQDAWRKSYTKIKDAVAMIEQHPGSCRIPVELEGLHITQYRQVLAGMNRIIYERRADMAYVHLICDARRDLKSVLMQRLTRPDA